MKSIRAYLLTLVAAGALILAVMSLVNFRIISKTFEKELERTRKTSEDILFESEKKRVLSLVDASYHIIKSLQKEELKEAKRTIRAYTNTLVSTIYNIYLSSLGKLRPNELKRNLISLINSFKYKPNGYFFAVDENRVVVACAQKELIGKRVEELPAIPKNIAERLIKTAKEGGGVVVYKWKKPGSQTLETKVAYVEKLHILDWFLGTGIYLGDIKKKLKERAASIIRSGFYNVWVFDRDSKEFAVASHLPRPLLEKAKELRIGELHRVKVEGKNYLCYSREIPSWSWVVGSCFSEGDMASGLNLSGNKIRSAFYTSAFVTLLGVSAIYVIFYLFGVRNMIEDLRRIKEGIENLIITRLSRADPCLSGEKVVDIKRRDEIGEIANLLNTIVEKTFYLRCFKATIEEDDDPSTIYRRLMDVIKERIGVKRAVIMEMDNMSVKAVVASDSELEERYRELDTNSQGCRAFKTGRYVFNTPSLKQCENSFEEGNAVCIPFNTGEKVIGVAKLLFPADIDPMELREKVDEAQVFINEATPVLEAKLYARHIKEFSLRDPLTNLYNRRYLQEYLEHLAEVVKRKESVMGVLMMDIDHFKNVNDTYGHATGDQVLKSIAHTLTRSVRRSDLVVRYGGEEFLVILMEVKRGLSTEVAEKIRKNVERSEIHVAGEKPIRVTVTVGVSEFPVDTDDVWQAIRLADIALYKGKEMGRNRCVRYAPEKS